MSENNQIMPNKVKAFVPVMLDKERRLKLDSNAMIAFEEQTGKSWLTGSVNPSKLKYKEWCILVWSMLLTDDPALTLKQVQDFADLMVMRRLTPYVVKAINIALEADEEDKAPLAESPQPG